MPCGGFCKGFNLAAKGMKSWVAGDVESAVFPGLHFPARRVGCAATKNVSSGQGDLRRAKAAGKFLTGGLARKFQPSERLEQTRLSWRLTQSGSVADSKVWMKEDTQRRRVGLGPRRFFFGVIFL